MEKVIEKGEILDGRWEFVEHSNNGAMYEFKNIYNGIAIKLSARQVKMVKDGKDTISHIQTRRLRNVGKTKGNPMWWTNGVNKAFARQINKYNK